VPSVVNPGSGMVSGMSNDIFFGYGTPPADPRYANIPENGQLKNLSMAVETAGKAPNLTNSRCTQLQFFGEYLHTFEDTFAHCDSRDMPFALIKGVGHGLYGSDPDYTYNHSISAPKGSAWNTNEARTLQAEKEAFAKMSAWADPSKARSFADIEQTLKAFNAIHESEGDGKTTEERQLGYPKKIQALQNALKRLGYTGIDITQSGRQSFNTEKATGNRASYLRDRDKKNLDQLTYSGTILPRK